MDKMLFVIVLICIIGFGSVVAYLLTRPPKVYQSVTIEELLESKEKYINKYLNVSGYLEYVDKVHWVLVLPHIWYSSDDKGNPEAHVGIQIVEQELYLFHLHSCPTEDSPYIVIVHKYSGLYLPVFPLPFWYSPSWHHEQAAKEVINPELGYALGKWCYAEVKDHGNMWYLDGDDV
jgi:hypothetical protein